MDCDYCSHKFFELVVDYIQKVTRAVKAAILLSSSTSSSSFAVQTEGSCCNRGNTPVHPFNVGTGLKVIKLRLSFADIFQVN